MATGKRDKTTRRAAHYETAIRQLQADGDHKAAVDEAKRWLFEELAKVRRQRPHECGGVDVAVADGLMQLAAQVPTYKPTAEEVRRAAV